MAQGECRRRAAVNSPAADTPWHRRAEAGHEAGLWIIETVARHGGRRLAHLVVGPVAAWYWLTRGAERRASRDFLARVAGHPVSVLASLRHFHTFAKVAVDRLFLFADRGRRIPMHVGKQHAMEDLLRAGRGCILLSAHFGSFEAARQAGLTNPLLRLHLLLDRAVNRRLVSRLERLDPGFARDILDAAGESMALTLRIGECLRAGDWVGWLGDRHRGEERTVSVDFLGAPARFPASPFIIAHLYRVPIHLVLATFNGTGYTIAVETLVDDVTLATPDRDAFVRAAARRYADSLSHHVRQTPNNWFNFYDFWSA